MKWWTLYALEGLYFYILTVGYNIITTGGD